MDAPLRAALAAYASISIIGMSKNAGKTTVLNRLLSLLTDMPRVPGVTSIGRDGETTDVVTGTKKPGIWVRGGTLVATAADMLRLSDITREILETTGMHTPLGEVVLLRALSDGTVQLAGPSMTAQIAEIVAALRAQGADIVLVDGALSRKSLAAPVVSEATILCAGASYSPDMLQVVADTAFACRLLQLPETEGAHPRRHVLEGAATEAALRGLSLRHGDEICVRDSSCILLSRAAFERAALQGVRFTVQRRTALCCVCVNPFSARGAGFDARQFGARMAEAVSVPVINVEEASI